MVNETQISSDEVLAAIDDFPGYSVSNFGRVLNDSTGCYMSLTKKPQGLVMVGLMKGGIQYKRSVPLLVARAHLPKPTNEAFDTPVNRDGDRSNNRADNLMWRPLWFSRRYMRQFDDGHATFNRPIEDVETGETYKNSMHASYELGLLDIDIVLSMLNNTYVWPTGQIFREHIEG